MNLRILALCAVVVFSGKRILFNFIKFLKF